MNFKRSATLLLVGFLAISMVATPAMAQSAALNDFNEDASAAQNPFISTDVTVSNYDRTEMSPGEYENDAGNIEQLPAEVNSSTNVDDIGSGSVNPYSFVASDIQFEDAAKFPRANDSVSAVNNESRWATDESATGGTISVADSSTASGVEALEVSTSSQTSGDVATATFSDVSITSDISKRYIQTILDVDELDSSTTVELRAVDADGDYVATTINTTETATDADVIADGTGEGYVLQEQIGSLTTQGSGDGTMAEIDSIEVVVMGGDAQVTISALNADKTSEWALGDERVDSDDDDEFETETIRDVSEPGQIDIYELDSLGTVFAEAEINDLTMPVHFQASDLENEGSKVNVTFDAADEYPNFDTKQTARYRLELPSAYDLSYSNAKLKQEFTLPDSRHQSLELLEGASDTSFSDLSGWTDVSDKVSSDDEVVLDDTIQPGQAIAYKSVTLITDDEQSAIENIGGGPGQFGVGGGGGLGGILNWLWGLPGAAIATVGGLLGRAKGVI